MLGWNGRSKDSEDATFFGLRAARWVGCGTLILAASCGGLPAYPQPPLSEDAVVGEAVAFTDPDDFAPCEPGAIRSCRPAFETAEGVVCVERFQACGEEGAWLRCGVTSRNAPGPALAVALAAGGASGADDPRCDAFSIR